MSTVLLPARVVDMVMYAETGVLYSQFTDGGSTAGTYQVGFELQVGFFVEAAFVTQVTGFTGDTSAAITVGDGSDVDRYNAGTPTVFTTISGLYLGVPSGTRVIATANKPTITVTSGADWGSVTAGQLDIRIYGHMAY